MRFVVILIMCGFDVMGFNWFFFWCLSINFLSEFDFQDLVMYIWGVNIFDQLLDGVDVLFWNFCVFWNVFCNIVDIVGWNGDMSFIGLLWVNFVFFVEFLIKFFLLKEIKQVVKIYDLQKLFN